MAKVKQKLKIKSCTYTQSMHVDNRVDNCILEKMIETNYSNILTSGKNYQNLKIKFATNIFFIKLFNFF